jgi:hypothetical protein
VIQEGETTIKARDILIKALKAESFTVQEEKVFHCKNNMGEEINPPYKADIYASINFIIELDPVSSHGGDHRTRKDNWRNENLFKQYGIRTVRLQPDDILKDIKLETTFKEMLSQLKEYEK